jgi:hypothetical protein
VSFNFGGGRESGSSAGLIHVTSSHVLAPSNDYMFNSYLSNSDPPP